MAFQIKTSNPHSSPKRSSSFDQKNEDLSSSKSFFTFTDGPFNPPIHHQVHLPSKNHLNPKLSQLIDLVGSFCASSIDELEWIKKHAIDHESEVISFLVFYFKTFMQAAPSQSPTIDHYASEHPDCCVFYYSGWSGQGVVCIPWSSIQAPYLSLAKDIHLQTIEFALHHPFSSN